MRSADVFRHFVIIIGHSLIQLHINLMVNGHNTLQLFHRPFGIIPKGYIANTLPNSLIFANCLLNRCLEMSGKIGLR